MFVDVIVQIGFSLSILFTVISHVLVFPALSITVAVYFPFVSTIFLFSFQFVSFTLDPPVSAGVTVNVIDDDVQFVLLDFIVHVGIVLSIPLILYSFAFVIPDNSYYVDISSNVGNLRVLVPYDKRLHFTVAV